LRPEYNHPYPNLYTTATPTVLSVVSKLQDYDGVFMFNFLDHRVMEPVSYFNQATKFACKAVYPVAALIMREPRISPLPEELLWKLGNNETSNDMKQLKRLINPYYNELAARSAGFFDLFKTKRIALTLTAKGNHDFSKINYSVPEHNAVLDWENSVNDYHQAFFKYDCDRAKVYIGWNVLAGYDFHSFINLLTPPHAPTL
jgi:hypothetical protein